MPNNRDLFFHMDDNVFRFMKRNNITYQNLIGKLNTYDYIPVCDTVLRVNNNFNGYKHHGQIVSKKLITEMHKAKDLNYLDINKFIIFSDDSKKPFKAIYSEIEKLKFGHMVKYFSENEHITDLFIFDVCDEYQGLISRWQMETYGSIFMEKMQETEREKFV